MNTIIYSQQGSFHRTTKDQSLTSVVSRLNKVSDISLKSFTSIRSKFGGIKTEVKNKSKIQKLVDALVDYRSQNYHILTLKDVLNNITLRQKK